MCHDRFWNYIEGKRQVGNVVNNVIPLLYNLEYLQSEVYIVYGYLHLVKEKKKIHELALYIKFKIMVAFSDRKELDSGG